MKGSIGAPPTFGNLTVDFNLQRRIKAGDTLGAASRWVPDVTGTYTFNHHLSASLGAGYYTYDDPSFTQSFWEVYGAVDMTPADSLKFHSEFS